MSQIGEAIIHYLKFCQDPGLRQVAKVTVREDLFKMWYPDQKVWNVGVMEESPDPSKLFDTYPTYSTEGLVALMVTVRPGPTYGADFRIWVKIHGTDYVGIVQRNDRRSEVFE